MPFEYAVWIIFTCALLGLTIKLGTRKKKVVTRC